VLASETDVKYAPDFGKGTVDLAGQRVLVMRTEMLGSLQRDLRRILGAAGSSLLYMIGDSIGRSTFDLYGKGARTEKDAWRVLDSCFRMMGWGRLNSHMGNDQETSAVTIGNSVFSDNVWSTQPNCDILRGILRGWHSSFSSLPVRVEEETCISCGHHACTFTLLKGP
jgi:predicted hydrocarbon binding protein